MSAQSSAKPSYTDIPRLTQDEAHAAAERLIAASGQSEVVCDEELRRLERFYNKEARLLDTERYGDWYDLLADDLFYWMPLQENRFRRDTRRTIAPENMALYDDCKADIAIRLGRLSSNQVWTEDPPTRHVYIISNVEGFETDREGEIEAHSTFLQYRCRSEHDEATLVGRRRDFLRRVGDDYKIVARMILIPQSVLLTKNLSVFF